MMEKVKRMHHLVEMSRSATDSYHQFINLLKTSQPTYLPPLDPSPPQLVSSPNPAQTSYKRFINEEKEILDYITRISSPHPQTQSLKTKNESEAIPTGHTKELEKIGKIGLHLSDFETEVNTVYFFCCGGFSSPTLISRIIFWFFASSRESILIII